MSSVEKFPGHPVES